MKGIAAFSDKCLNLKHVNVDNYTPIGMDQYVKLPKLKWEKINMEFITCLPIYHMRHDSISVIVNRITKLVHFLSIKTTHSAKDYSKLYLQDMVRLHKVPVSILSDRGAQLTP